MGDSRSVSSIENEVFEALRAMLPEASFNTWFSNASIESHTDNVITIGAANRFVKAWLENNYRDIIAEAAKSILGTKPEVKVIISRLKYKEQISELAAPTAKEAANGMQVATTAAVSQNLPLFQRSKHTFANFTAGRCNHFALAAAKQAVDCPGEYSPLYIFGGHGLGKTHLLHAICSEYSINNPGNRILCITPDYFVQCYAAAHMNNRLGEFKKRFEECDLLVIDDFQNFTHGKKTASQKELVAILDNMLHKNRQVVIAAVTALHTLSSLDPMLSSRLSGGLQARLDVLDPETRCAIIKSKGGDIPQDVASYISSQSTGSVRELEGLVKTVTAMSKISGIAPDISSVEALITPKAIDKPDMEVITHTVSEVFQVSMTEIIGKKRQGSITQARRVAVHLTRRFSGNSLNEIGEFFGTRKHTTILNILKNGIGRQNPLLVKKLEEVLLRLNQKIQISELFKGQSEIF